MRTGPPASPLDRSVPQRAAPEARPPGGLAREEADALRLPLTLTVRGDSDDAILTDELGAKALRAVEKFDQAFRFRDGRMAVPHSLAIDLVRRHGGVLQVAFG